MDRPVVLRADLERLLRVLGFQDRVAVGCQSQADGRANAFFIFDEQDSLGTPRGNG